MSPCCERGSALLCPHAVVGARTAHAQTMRIRSDRTLRLSEWWRLTDVFVARRKCQHQRVAASDSGLHRSLQSDGQTPAMVVHCGAAGAQARHECITGSTKANGMLTFYRLQRGPPDCAPGASIAPIDSVDEDQSSPGRSRRQHLYRPAGAR